MMCRWQSPGLPKARNGSSGEAQQNLSIPQAKAAYKNGLKLWKTSKPGSRKRRVAGELIRRAAASGYHEARMMARLHGIAF